MNVKSWIEVMNFYKHNNWGPSRVALKIPEQTALALEELSLWLGFKMPAGVDYLNYVNLKECPLRVGHLEVLLLLCMNQDKPVTRLDVLAHTYKATSDTIRQLEYIKLVRRDPITGILEPTLLGMVLVAKLDTLKEQV